MDDVGAFYYLNTNVLLIKNARSQLAGGGILNGLTGTAVVQDKSGVVVANGGPVAVTYLAGSQGGYQAIFSALIAVPPGQFVRILVNLDGGANLTYRKVLNARVVEG